MPVVRMPDGQQVNFPDDMPPEQIKQIIATKFPEVVGEQQAAPTPQEPSLGRNIADVLQKRKIQLRDITMAPNQRAEEMALQYAGTGLATLGDVAGTLVGAGAKTGYQALPGGVQETLEDVGMGILESKIGQLGIEALQKGGEVWEGFKQENPRAGRNIEAIANIAMAIPTAKTVQVAGEVGEKAIKAGVPVLKETAEQLATGAKRVKGMLKRDPIKSALEIKKLSSAAYKAADDAGGTLKPQFTNKFLAKMESLAPQTEVGRLVAGDDAFTQIVEKFSSIRNKPITLQAAQEVDELLGDAIDKYTELGKLTKEGKKLLEVQTSFRNMIGDAPVEMIEGGKEGFDALKRARKLWSQSRKMEDIERIIQRASMTDNPATAIKTGFRNLYFSPGRMKGFTPAEKKLISKAAQSGVVTDLFRTVGSRLVPIIAGTTGAGVGTTAAATAASTAARGAASRMQIGQAMKVAREISKGVQ